MRLGRYSYYSTSSLSLSSSSTTMLQSATASTSASSTSPVSLRFIEFPSPSQDSPLSTSEQQDPPVILLHGLLGSKRNFVSLGTLLVKQLRKKRRVLAVDLRNHGAFFAASCSCD